MPASEDARLDVAIVGSGPGGALCARVLAEEGARICLFEQESLPRYKTCGGGLVGKARRLSRLDVDALAESVFDSCAVELSDARLRFEMQRDEPVVTMAMRADFDAALVREARRAGAEVRDACAVRALSQDGDGAVLDTDAGSFRARMVVAADGALGPVAGWAGFEKKPRLIPALEWELWLDTERARAHREIPLFDFGAIERGYAWVFPKRDHFSVGILSTRFGAKGLQPALESWLEGLGLMPAERIEKHGFQIPIAPRPGGFGRGRVLLVGDSAGLADPVTCEGISNALLSGKLAAEALLEASFHPGRSVRAYRRGLSREVLPELRTARLLAKLVYDHPRARARLFERRGQGLAKAMAEVIAGRTTYRQLAWRPGNWIRALRRGAPV